VDKPCGAGGASRSPETSHTLQNAGSGMNPCSSRFEGGPIIHRLDKDTRACLVGGGAHAGALHLPARPVMARTVASRYLAVCGASDRRRQRGMNPSAGTAPTGWRMTFARMAGRP